MAQPRSLRKINTNDVTLQLIQENVDAALRTLSTPLQNGVLITGITLTTNDTKVSHKLGRIPVGYIVVKRSTAATVFDTALTDTFLTLKATTPTIVSIWVF